MILIPGKIYLLPDPIDGVVTLSLKLYFCSLVYTIMESTRQKKVARMIQKELAVIFQQESRNLFKGKLISVTVVHVTPDLALAKVHLSFFPSDDRDKFLRIIEGKNKFIRHELSKKIRYQVKSIPELAFYIDDSLDYVENIENLLKD